MLSANRLRFWRDALDKGKPWRDRSQAVEDIVRATLATFAVGEVMTTREFVDRLFPVPSDGLSAEDLGARSELVNRVLILAKHVPGLAHVTLETPARGPNKGREVRRYLWSRLELSDAVRAPASVPVAPDIGDEIQAIRDRLRLVEAGLSALGQSIAAFQASVTTKE